MDAIDKINTLLARKGITGAELERKIGVSNSVYSQWNTKSTKPSQKSLVKVAEALEVDVSEILPDKKEKPTAESGELSGKDMKFVEIVSSLGRDMQTILDAIAKDPTYRPKREEKFVEVVCPLSGRIETIHQVYYVHDGKRVPYLNNGCDNRYACAECNQCQVRVMESVR